MIRKQTWQAASLVVIFAGALAAAAEAPPPSPPPVPDPTKSGCLSENQIKELAKATIDKAKSRNFKEHTQELEFRTALDYFLQHVHDDAPKPTDSCWLKRGDALKLLAAAAQADANASSFQARLAQQTKQEAANAKMRESYVKGVKKVEKVVAAVITGRPAATILPSVEPPPNAVSRKGTTPPTVAGGAKRLPPPSQLPRSFRSRPGPPPPPINTRPPRDTPTATPEQIAARARERKQAEQARQKKSAEDKRRRREEYFAQRRRQAREGLKAEEALDEALKERRKIAGEIAAGKYSPRVAEAYAFAANHQVELAEKRVKALDPLAERQIPNSAKLSPRRQSRTVEYSFDGHTWASMKTSIRPNGTPNPPPTISQQSVIQIQNQSVVKHRGPDGKLRPYTPPPRRSVVLQTPRKEAPSAFIWAVKLFTGFGP